MPLFVVGSEDVLLNYGSGMPCCLSGVEQEQQPPRKHTQNFRDCMWLQRDCLEEAAGRKGGVKIKIFSMLRQRCTTSPTRVSYLFGMRKTFMYHPLYLVIGVNDER